MGNETTTRLLMEHIPHEYAYETVETVHAIAARIQQITSTVVEKVALVTITLLFDSEGKANAGRFLHVNQSSIYLLTSLRPLVRKTDEVFLLDNTFHFLLLAANQQGGEIVQARLWDALLWRIHNSIDGEIVRPQSMTIGSSAFPTPCRDINEFIEAARVMNLHSDPASARSTRKALTRQTKAEHQKDVTHEELPALARKLGIPYLSLLPRKPLERIQQLVNPRLARELHCYPLGRERDMLTVAMLNPQDCTVLDRLQQETGLRIFPVLTHAQELQTALEQLF